MMAGDELYDDDVTSGVSHIYPISGPGPEPSGVTPARAADGPGATSSDGGSPETERATVNVASPDRTHVTRLPRERASQSVPAPFRTVTPRVPSAAGRRP